MANNELNDTTKLPEKACYSPQYLSLPSAWDSSVSQLEMLQKMLYNINMIINYLNDLQTNYEEYTENAVAVLKQWTQEQLDILKAYHDQSLADLKAYVDTQDGYYWQEHLKDVANINNKITELRSYVDQNFKDIRDKHTGDVQAIYQKIDDVQSSLIAYINNNNEYIKTWAQDEINKVLDLVDEINENGFRIFNPVTGEKDHVNEAVNDVFNALRYGACTALQFDDWFVKFNKDGTDFKNLYMTTIQYDISGYDVMYHDLLERCNSPVSGKEVDYCRAISDASMLANKEALTCQERDNLELTGDDYISLNKSAMYWDSQSLYLYNTPDNYIVSRAIDDTNGYIRYIRVKNLPKDLLTSEECIATYNINGEAQLGFVDTLNTIQSYQFLCVGNYDASMLANKEALTCQERDNLELTGDDYISLNKSAMYWDSQSLYLYNTPDNYIVSRAIDDTNGYIRYDLDAEVEVYITQSREYLNGYKLNKLACYAKTNSPDIESLIFDLILKVRSNDFKYAIG